MCLRWAPMPRACAGFARRLGVLGCVAAASSTLYSAFCWVVYVPAGGVCVCAFVGDGG
jgi:hypothetical protein